MSNRLHKTLADYLAIAVSPALIIALVGSLVFFLLELFPKGHFHGRMQFILGLFVIAAVLIGRISIEESLERAAMFALPLAVLVAIAIYRFGGGDLRATLLAMGLMALIWWSAHKLTWDCTLIDENDDASGKGLLHVVGWDESETPTESETQTEPEGVTSPDAPRLSWSQRLADEAKRPHAPGVWIVYFSLAALPIFGIGQRIIPAEDVEARRYAFWLLGVYVASGLGLLLLTSFLGLRRYLRQRHLQMPATMANAWIATGLIMIVVLLATAAILPRPASEYAVSDLPFGIGALEREDNRSSRFAMGDGVEDNRHEPRPGKPADPQDESARHEDDTENSSDKTHSGQTDDQQSGDAQGEGKPSSDGSGGKSQQEGGAPKEGKSSEGKSSSEESGESGESGEESQEKSGEDSKSRSGEKTSQNESDQNDAHEQEDNEQEGNDQEDTSRQTSPRPPLLPQTMGSWVMTLFRWAIFGTLFVVVAVWIWRSWDKIRVWLAGLLDAWKAFWANLFGSKTDRDVEQAEADSPGAKTFCRPFSDFPNPFATGMARQVSRDELVRYSFEATEAWAREHGWAREPEQTPHEFANQIGGRISSLANDARRLADLYCAVAYAQGTLPKATIEHLERLWGQLRPGQPVHGA